MNPEDRKQLDVILIGYEIQENLGIRYIAANLERHGYRALVAPFTRDNAEEVIRLARESSPRIIGFSVIFQYTLEEMDTLMAQLRDAGIMAHFTAGGHFPSLAPEQTLGLLTHLDTLARFEGEATIIELLEKLDEPERWAEIEGLVFRSNGGVVVNSPRPLISDLDTLPRPQRGGSVPALRGMKQAAVLASRGCQYNCSFCSIRSFYRGAPGSLRRIRSPDAVANEIHDLWRNSGIGLFTFQDDDFAGKTAAQRQWVRAFLNCLRQRGLDREILWKISCRVDDIDEDLLAECRSHGLLFVYLGVESGNSTGLKTLNKGVTVEQNKRAIETVLRVGLYLSVGFMLFDPDSTIGTIRENLEFLRWLGKSGNCVINFCKMLPYVGTTIEKRLQSENRLIGTAVRPDYDFLDPRLDYYSNFVLLAFRFRNFDPLGLVQRLQLAQFDVALARASGIGFRMDEYQSDLAGLISRSNMAAVNLLERGLDFIDDRPLAQVGEQWDQLETMASEEQEAETRMQMELDSILQEYNQELYEYFAYEAGQRLSAARAPVS